MNDSRTIQRAFFTALFSDLEGYIGLATIYRPSPNQKKFEHNHYYRWPNQADAMLDFISEQSNLGRDVYMCPTLLIRPRRKKQFVGECLVLWADLDECDPAVVNPKPSLVVRSSEGRWQAYWRLKESATPELAESLSKAIAYTYADLGADKGGWDLTQLLRIPGTFNYKYEEPQPIVLMPVGESGTAWYTAEQVEEILDVRDIQRSDEDLVPASARQLSGDKIIQQYSSILHPRVADLYEEEPTDDWSSSLWELERSLVEAGLSREEVFAVARDSACNKYKRDKRQEHFLWREVGKAFEQQQEYSIGVSDLPIDKPLRRLLTDEDWTLVQGRRSFVEWYMDWATKQSDAAPVYHQGGAFVILSSLLSGQVHLPTSVGTVKPNMWFMLLADTTLTRKSTAMDMAMDMLEDVESDTLLATDGTIEGMLSSMEKRPGQPSVFLRDEVTGLMEAVTRKEYMSGMLETLTKLYDGKTMKRVLRSETIEVKDPVLIFFAGGIKTKMMELLDYTHINTGFLPRFVFLMGEADTARLRPVGPPTMESEDLRGELVRFLTKMNDHYKNKGGGHSSGKTVTLPKVWAATMTEAAWRRYNRYEAMMIEDAIESHNPEVMTPIMDRLAKSGLKAALLIAASSRLEDEITVKDSDVIRAFSFVERWRDYSVYLVENIGIGTNERRIQYIAKFIMGHSQGVPRSKIMQIFRMTASEADNLLKTLEQRGLVYRKKAGRGERYFPATGIAGK